MKEKKILTFMIVLCVIGFSIIVNIFAEKRFATNWFYISQVVYLGMMVEWLIYSYNKVEKYQTGSYMWYKLLGEKEQIINVDLLIKMMIPIGICVCISIGFGNYVSIGGMVISIINVTLFCIDSMFLIYRSRYKGNIMGKMAVATMIACGIEVLIVGIRAILHSKSTLDFYIQFLGNKYVGMMIGIIDSIG